MTDAQRAERLQELKRAARSAPSGVARADRDELARVFGSDGAADGDEPAFADAYLRLHGFRTRPKIGAAAPGVQVELRYGSRLALETAIIISLIVFIPAAAAYWVYGLAVAGAGVVAALVLARAWHRVDHTLPAVVPRGRAAGAAIVIPALIVVGLAVVLPVRQHRIDQASTSSAAALVRQADAAIDNGDLSGAKQLLFKAEGAGRQPAFTADVRAHLIVAQVEQLLAEQDRKVVAYERAKELAAAHRLRAAAALLAKIPGFRDADALARAYRRAGR